MPAGLGLPSGPIAIGGVGGSGTRVVAAFVRALGVDIGPELNPPLDNLWFTLMFKRRSWSREPPAPKELAGAIETFCRSMQGRRLDMGDVRRIVGSTTECALSGHNVKGSGRGIWAVKVGMSMLRSRLESGQLWGWKEPNTHVFLPELAHAIPNLNYVHVIRDGLVMADSKNWDQAALWADRYGISLRKRRPSRWEMLEYWIRANERAVEFGSELDGRFALIRFESLIENPETELRSLAARLGLPMSPPAVRIIDSVDERARSRQVAYNDLPIDPGTADRMARLGYPVARNEG